MMNKNTLFFSVAIALFAILLCVPAFAASGHGEESPGLSPIDFRMETAVWTLVIFLIVVFVLGKFAFKPIVQALDAREKAVADNIDAAARANDEAKVLLEQYKQKLADSKDEVRQILETARNDAQRSADGIVAKAREAAQMEQQRAVKDIEAATDAALQSIAQRSATLATNLAGKMIRKEVTPEAHRDLIGVALEEFTKN